MSSIQCPCCASAELSPEVSHARFDTGARFENMGKKGTFSRKDLVMGGDRARFCLDCGYMLLFADESDLEQLRSALKERAQ